MTDAMRAMLDELMGKERDVPLAQRSGRRVRFYDKDVCKHELAGLCPNTLFKNTRSDLGPCGFEIHEEHLDWEEIKGEYDALSEREKDRYGYERDLHRYLSDLIRDMDRKIARGRERAEAESRPRDLKPEDNVRLDALMAQMKDALDKSAAAAEAGEVDESLLFSQAAESYKSQHDALHRQLTAPERIMSVCDICGVFISSTDNEARRQEHLTGKQYLGWKRIREHYAELSARLGRSGRASAEPPHPSEYDRDRDRHRSSRDRSRSPGGGGGSGDRRRDHHRDYDRGSSRYGGSGGADRDRDYGRDRGRDDRYDSREHRGSRRDDDYYRRR